MTDILPDSRLHVNHTPKNMVQGPDGMWVPFYCAHCGAEGGLCPEKNMTFAFYICRKCEDACGPITGMMMLPDEVFFEKLKNEQLESHGRYLTEDEFALVIAEDCTPLATLIKEAK